MPFFILLHPLATLVLAEDLVLRRLCLCGVAGWSNGLTWSAIGVLVMDYVLLECCSGSMVVDLGRWCAIGVVGGRSRLLVSL